MTTKRIAAAIKPILDEDRRADRERIAELEKDAAHLSKLNHEIIDDLFKQLDYALTQVAALRRQLVSVVESPTEITTPFGTLPCDANGMRRLIDEIVKLNDDRVALGVERDAALIANVRLAREKTEMATSSSWQAAFCDWWCIVGTRRDGRVEVWGGKLGWNTIGALAYADKRDADAELKRLGRPALLDDVHVTTMAEWRRVMS